MTERSGIAQERPNPQLEMTGPQTAADVMRLLEDQGARGDTAHLRPMATGFDPLDDILSGGLRSGELLVIGGPYGVGKTIWGLQTARNAVVADDDNMAIYVCYEHDRAHLLSRLMCLESASMGHGDRSLTMRRIGELLVESGGGSGPISRLRRSARYGPVVEKIESYADRLVLTKASGDLSTLSQIREWVEESTAERSRRVLLVVDYLQKIPVDWSAVQPEVEVTTHLTQGLKELAMSKGLRTIAISASDRAGLKAKRMRLSDMRGSSAVQYEADIGLILNNKFAIISREHLIYNPTQAEKMRSQVVMSVEKNRAGRNTVDMEFALDAAHFRIVPVGSYVRERLVDEKVTLE